MGIVLIKDGGGLATECGCLVQLLGGFWPPEAEAGAKRVASRAASPRRASAGSRPAT
jgi:hypothetical protein